MANYALLLSSTLDLFEQNLAYNATLKVLIEQNYTRPIYLLLMLFNLIAKWINKTDCLCLLFGNLLKNMQVNLILCLYRMIQYHYSLIRL